ncbi:MAG: histidine kinase, partial [Pseudomonadota bacterium]
MRQLYKYLMTALLALTVAGLVQAQEAAHRGTADEAVAMVKKASAYLQKNGKDRAVAAFNDPKGEFVSGDLYVFMIDTGGMMLAHGQNPKMVNKPMMELNAGGVYPVKEFLKLTNGPAGKGWV